MKLSFSTNGRHSLEWQDFFSVAHELNYAGIEIHDLLNEVFTGVGGPFSNDNIYDTVRHIRAQNLQIPCIDAICNIAYADKLESNIEEINKYIDYAKKLRTPYVRIRAHKTESNANIEDETVKKLIESVIKFAKESEVTLLIETTGIYADTRRLVEILDYFATDTVACLWDLNHPYRFFNEEAEDTIKNLGAYVKFVHIKDSKIEDGDIRYCLMGEGDLPINEMIDALNSIGYDGFLSFECDSKWLDKDGLEDIALPHFVNYMYRFNNKKKRESDLYNNKTETGKFVWEKDKLIDYTFSQVLDKMVEKFPDQYAFKYTTLDYTRTYLEFRNDVDTFARALIALGVEKGTHVAVWATNEPEWYIAFWATTKIGAVFVSMNTAYKIQEAEYLLRQSDAHTLIMIESCRDSNYKEIINKLCPNLKETEDEKDLHCKRLPFLRNIITISFENEGCLTWKKATDLASRVPIQEVYRRANEVDVHDVANMQYTSGTTGFPKGVMLTHYNIVNNGKCIGDRMDLSTADRMMIQVPMFHCFGMVLSMTASMTHGASLMPLPYFSAKAALACINQERITCFNGVPTMFIAMLEHKDFEKTDFSYIRTGIMAGSPCPISVMRDVVEKMNMKEITIVYGQTEASPGCTMSSTDDPLEVRVGTVGGPLPRIECRIINTDTGEEEKVGVTGEFVARGYNIMKGYYKMPKATKKAIDSDGWLHTGDLACKTLEGNFKITGRLKDMIIRGGENIYPKEIEEFIYTHPKVKDVQVIGIPDEQYGEEIMACVILKDNEQMDEIEMKDYVKAHMARYKVPRYVDFIDEFPMNVAGKILKYKLRQDEIEKLGLGK